MLLEDAAVQRLNEMSTIGPWIDRQGKLQWDYVTAAGFKVARNVRNGDLGGAATKAALIESEGYMFNKHDKLCITEYHKKAKLGGAALAKIFVADALGEHHTRICISALCQRGASVKWEKAYPVVVHLCYDPQQSGVAGQPPRQKKGLKLHVCKKCQRTAKDCKGGAGCRALACSNTSLKSCQHLH